MARTDLLLALFGDLLGDDPWTAFLSGLLARTGADRLHLLTPEGDHRVARPDLRPDLRSEAEAQRERAALAEPLPSLRPHRVYALDEWRTLDGKAARAAQDERLGNARIGDARFVRLGGQWSAVSLILLAERTPLTAADAALLSSLLPALELALTLRAQAVSVRRRADAAEDALALMGIAQAVTDERGTLLAADPRWLARPPQVSGPSAPFTDRTLAFAPDGTAVLLRPAAEAGTLIAAVRAPHTEISLRASHILSATLGLSKREASLAVLLAQGRSLIEAGRALSLTDETTRSYSKRIYSKTGTSGQADLVRLVMTSLAPLG